MTTATIKPSIEQIFNTAESVLKMGKQPVYERVGSMIWWDVKGGFNLAYEEAKHTFEKTVLKNHIQPVVLYEAMKRFTEKVVQRHGTLFNKQLQSMYDRVKIGDDWFYCLVFFTGKADKESTDFSQKGKLLISNDYISCVESDEQFLFRDYDVLKSEFDECFNVTHQDVQKALSAFANTNGYRFNHHGGHYFIPHHYTDDLYRLKNVIKNFGQSLAITPIIAGCDEDLEEIVNIIGCGFKEDLADCKKQIFEVCLKEFGLVDEWSKFVECAQNRDLNGCLATKINQTSYGKELIKSLLDIGGNASEIEWNQVIKQFVLNVKPVGIIRTERLYNIRKQLQDAVDKLYVAGESPLINKWLNRMLEEVHLLNATLKKLGDKLHQELLIMLQ